MPWSSLVEEDEGSIGPSGKHKYGIIPYMFDY